MQVIVGVLELIFIASIATIVIAINKWTDFFITNTRFRISILLLSGTVSWMLAFLLSTSKLAYDFHLSIGTLLVVFAAINIFFYAMNSEPQKTGTG